MISSWFCCTGQIELLLQVLCGGRDSVMFTFSLTFTAVFELSDAFVLRGLKELWGFSNKSGDADEVIPAELEKEYHYFHFCFITHYAEVRKQLLHGTMHEKNNK